MSCKNCKVVATKRQFTTRRSVESFLRKLRDLVDDGRIVEFPSYTDLRRVEDDASWPEVIECQFGCPDCGLEFTFKAEYAYDYGMPQWVARIDHVLSPLHLERLFLGRHKYAHYRVWYRDVLVPAGAKLRFFTGMGERAPGRSDGVVFRVEVAELRDGRPRVGRLEGPFAELLALHGGHGQPTLASAKKGEALFEAVVLKTVASVQALTIEPLPKHG